MVGDFSFFFRHLCWLHTSIIELALCLMQTQINLWSPTIIAIYASSYKNCRSCCVCFGGLISNSSTHSGWIDYYCRMLLYSFFSLEKQTRTNNPNMLSVQILSPPAPLKPVHWRTIWNLGVFTALLSSSHPVFSIQNVNCLLHHEMLAGIDGDFLGRGSTEYSL